jgi:V/A-type H+-transporting ATPase subunit F
MKIAFVGPYNLVFPFKSLGAEIINTESKNIEEVKKEIESSDFAIVFVFERVFKKLLKYEDLMSSPEINVVPIPGIEGSQGYGKERIRDMVKKAVGMDIGGFNE